MLVVAVPSVYRLVLLELACTRGLIPAFCSTCTLLSRATQFRGLLCGLVLAKGRHFAVFLGGCLF